MAYRIKRKGNRWWEDEYEAGEGFEEEQEEERRQVRVCTSSGDLISNSIVEYVDATRDLDIPETTIEAKQRSFLDKYVLPTMEEESVEPEKLKNVRSINDEINRKVEKKLRDKEYENIEGAEATDGSVAYEFEEATLKQTEVNGEFKFEAVGKFNGVVRVQRRDVSGKLLKDVDIMEFKDGEMVSVIPGTEGISRVNNLKVLVEQARDRIVIREEEVSKRREKTKQRAERRRKERPRPRAEERIKEGRPERTEDKGTIERAGAEGIEKELRGEIDRLRRMASEIEAERQARAAQGRAKEEQARLQRELESARKDLAEARAKRDQELRAAAGGQTEELRRAEGELVGARAELGNLRAQAAEAERQRKLVEEEGKERLAKLEDSLAKRREELTARERNLEERISAGGRVLRGERKGLETDRKAMDEAQAELESQRAGLALQRETQEGAARRLGEREAELAAEGERVKRQQEEAGRQVAEAREAKAEAKRGLEAAESARATDRTAHEEAQAKLRKEAEEQAEQHKREREAAERTSDEKMSALEKSLRQAQTDSEQGIEGAAAKVKEATEALDAAKRAASEKEAALIEEHSKAEQRLSSKVEELERSAEEKAREHERVVAGLTEAEASARSAAERAQAAQSQLSEQMEALQKSHRAELLSAQTARQGEIEAANAVASRAREELTKATSAHSSREAELSGKVSAAQLAKESADRELAEIKKAQEARLSELEEANKKAVSAAEEARVSGVGAEEANKLAERRAQELLEAQREARSRIAEAESRSEELNKEVARLVAMDSQLRAQQASEREELETRIAVADSKATEAERRLAEAEARMVKAEEAASERAIRAEEAAREKVAEADGRAEKAKGDLDAANTAHDQREQELSAKVSAAESASTSADKELTEVKRAQEVRLKELEEANRKAVSAAEEARVSGVGAEEANKLAEQRAKEIETAQADADRRIAAATEKQEKLSARVSALEDQQKREKEKHQKDIIDLETRRSQAEAAKEAALQRSQELSDQLADREKAVAEIQKHILDENRLRLESLLKQLTKEKEAFEKERDATDEKIDRDKDREFEGKEKSADSESWIVDWETDIGSDREQKELRDRELELKEKLEELKKKEEEINKVLEQIRKVSEGSGLTEDQKQLEELIKNSSRLKQDLIDLIEGAKSERELLYGSEEENLKLKNESLKKQVRKYEKDVSKQVAIQVAEARELKGLRHRLSDLESQHEVERKKSEELKQETERLSFEARRKKEKRGILKKQLEAQGEKLKVLTTNEAVAREEVGSLTSQMSDLRTQQKKVEAGHKEEVAELGRRHKESQQKSREELEGLRKAHGLAEANSKDLNRQLDELRNNKQLSEGEREKRMTELQAQHDRAAKEVQAAKESLISVSAQMEEQKREFDGARETVEANHQKELQKQIANIETLKGQFVKATGKASVAEAARKESEARNAELTKQYEANRQSLAAMESQLEDLTGQSSEYQAEVSKLQKERQQLEEVYQGKTRDAEMKASEAERRLVAAEAEIEKVREEARRVAELAANEAKQREEILTKAARIARDELDLATTKHGEQERELNQRVSEVESEKNRATEELNRVKREQVIRLEELAQAKKIAEDAVRAKGLSEQERVKATELAELKAKELEEAKRDANSKVREGEEKHAGVKRSLDAKVSELEAERERVASENQVDIGRLQAEARNAESRALGAERRLAEAEARLAERVEEIEKSAQERVTKAEDSRARAVEELATVRSAHTEIEKTLKGEISVAQSAKVTADEELGRVKREQEETLSRLMEEATKAEEAAKAQMASQEAQREAERRTQKLEDAQADADKKIAEATSERDRLGAKVIDLETEQSKAAEAHRTEIATLTERMTSAEKNVEEAAEKLREAEARALDAEKRAEERERAAVEREKVAQKDMHAAEAARDEAKAELERKTTELRGAMSAAEASHKVDIARLEEEARVAKDAESKRAAEEAKTEAERTHAVKMQAMESKQQKLTEEVSKAESLVEEERKKHTEALAKKDIVIEERGRAVEAQKEKKRGAKKELAAEKEARTKEVGERERAEARATEAERKLIEAEERKTQKYREATEAARTVERKATEVGNVLPDLEEKLRSAREAFKRDQQGELDPEALSKLRAERKAAETELDDQHKLYKKALSSAITAAGKRARGAEKLPETEREKELEPARASHTRLEAELTSLKQKLQKEKELRAQEKKEKRQSKMERVKGEAFEEARSQTEDERRRLEEEHARLEAEQRRAHEDSEKLHDEMSELNAFRTKMEKRIAEMEEAGLRGEIGGVVGLVEDLNKEREGLEALAEKMREAEKRMASELSEAEKLERGLSEQELEKVRAERAEKLRVLETELAEYRREFENAEKAIQELEKEIAQPEEEETLGRWEPRETERRGVAGEGEEAELEDASLEGTQKRAKAYSKLAYAVNAVNEALKPNGMRSEFFERSYGPTLLRVEKGENRDVWSIFNVLLQENAENLKFGKNGKAEVAVEIYGKVFKVTIEKAPGSTKRFPKYNVLQLQPYSEPVVRRGASRRGAPIPGDNILTKPIRIRKNGNLLVAEYRGKNATKEEARARLVRDQYVDYDHQIDGMLSTVGLKRNRESGKIDKSDAQPTPGHPQLIVAGTGSGKSGIIATTALARGSGVFATQAGALVGGLVKDINDFVKPLRAVKLDDFVEEGKPLSKERVREIVNKYRYVVMSHEQLMSYGDVLENKNVFMDEVHSLVPGAHELGRKGKLQKLKAIIARNRVLGTTATSTSEVKELMGEPVYTLSLHRAQREIKTVRALRASEQFVAPENLAKEAVKQLLTREETLTPENRGYRVSNPQNRNTRLSSRTQGFIFTDNPDTAREAYELLVKGEGAPPEKYEEAKKAQRQIIEANIQIDIIVNLGVINKSRKDLQRLVRNGYFKELKNIYDKALSKHAIHQLGREAYIHRAEFQIRLLCSEAGERKNLSKVRFEQKKEELLNMYLLAVRKNNRNKEAEEREGAVNKAREEFGALISERSFDKLQSKFNDEIKRSYELNWEYERELREADNDRKLTKYYKSVEGYFNARQDRDRNSIASIANRLMGEEYREFATLLDNPEDHQAEKRAKALLEKGLTMHVVSVGPLGTGYSNPNVLSTVVVQRDSIADAPFNRNPVSRRVQQCGRPVRAEDGKASVANVISIAIPEEGRNLTFAEVYAQFDDTQYDSIEKREQEADRRYYERMQAFEDFCRPTIAATQELSKALEGLRGKIEGTDIDDSEKQKALKIIDQFDLDIKVKIKEIQTLNKKIIEGASNSVELAGQLTERIKEINTESLRTKLGSVDASLDANLAIIDSQVKALQSKQTAEAERTFAKMRNQNLSGQRGDAEAQIKRLEELIQSIRGEMPPELPEAGRRLEQEVPTPVVEVPSSVVAEEVKRPPSLEVPSAVEEGQAEGRPTSPESSVGEPSPLVPTEQLTEEQKRIYDALTPDMIEKAGYTSSEEEFSNRTMSPVVLKHIAGQILGKERLAAIKEGREVSPGGESALPEDVAGRAKKVGAAARSLGVQEGSRQGALVNKRRSPPKGSSTNIRQRR